VEIFKVEVAELLPGETEAGENEQLDAAGSPDKQVRETDEPKFPPRTVTVAVYLAVPPAETVTLEGEAVREKSRPVPVKDAVCGLPLSALSAIDSVPVRAPAAVGVKAMVSVQLAPATRAVPQLLDWEKSPVIEILEILSVAFPLLVSFTA